MSRKNPIIKLEIHNFTNNEFWTRLLGDWVRTVEVQRADGETRVYKREGRPDDWVVQWILMNAARFFPQTFRTSGTGSPHTLEFALDDEKDWRMVEIIDRLDRLERMLKEQNNDQ